GVLDGPAQALSFSDERAERYMLQVRLTDAAGNTDPANTASFTFDRDGSGSGSVVDSKLKIDHVARRGRRYAITAFLDPRATRPVHFALTRRAGAKTVLISRADAASHTGAIKTSLTVGCTSVLRTTRLALTAQYPGDAGFRGARVTRQLAVPQALKRACR